MGRFQSDGSTDFGSHVGEPGGDGIEKLVRVENLLLNGNDFRSEHRQKFGQLTELFLNVHGVPVQRVGTLLERGEFRFSGGDLLLQIINSLRKTTYGGGDFDVFGHWKLQSAGTGGLSAKYYLII